MVLSMEGDPVKNETVFTVKSSAVLKAVSILHECGSSRKFSI